MSRRTNRTHRKSSPTFPVTAYSINWKSADPTYDHTVRLVPTICLFGPVQDARNPQTVLIYFYPEGHVAGATRDATHDNLYYLELPIGHAANLIHLLENYPGLTFEYKEEETRTWAEIYTPRLSPGP